MIRKSKHAVPTERMDEIPTQPSAFKARVVSFAVLMLAGLFCMAYFSLPSALDAFFSRNADIQILFQKTHTASSLKLVFQLFGVIAIVSGAVGSASLFRSRLTYLALRIPLYASYALVGFYVWLTRQACSSILSHGLNVNGTKQDAVTRDLLWWDVSWPALAIAAYAGWVHVMLRSRSVHAAFTSETGGPMAGDRLLEDLRTHGRDPRHRRSLYASVFTHVFVLIIMPWVMSLGGCVEAYKVPKGSGNPVVAMVKMVKPKKKKKKQTLSLRANSSILFEIPDLDDAKVDQDMEEQTQATYQASNARAGNAKAGKMGKGGGTEGGWPEGMDDYKIRFIRLEHSGAGWDDGMDETDADINFLRAFAQSTGFKKIANKGESHSIGLLRKYPKNGFPPFVYLTGNSDMGHVTSADIKALREYCLNGGMLIADAGSARFHQSFSHLMRQVFPDKPLVDIADDEMIYQLPYSFPDGAPAFWHHGGRRALGVKHENRWCVFYHPGDMNDAWKSQAYTDVSPEMRDAAMNLGINLVYYAFCQWNDAISKANK